MGAGLSVVKDQEDYIDRILDDKVRIQTRMVRSKNIP